VVRWALGGSSRGAVGDAGMACYPSRGYVCSPRAAIRSLSIRPPAHSGHFIGFTDEPGVEPMPDVGSAAPAADAAPQSDMRRLRAQ
jgi:hypothetical protein